MVRSRRAVRKFPRKEARPVFLSVRSQQPDFALPELQLPPSVDLPRLESRRNLLQVIDDQIQLKEKFAEARGIDEFQQQSLSILSSPKLKSAFDLSKEPSELRDAYGRTTYGQSCLLADGSSRPACDLSRFTFLEPSVEKGAKAGTRIKTTLSISKIDCFRLPTIPSLH